MFKTRTLFSRMHTLYLAAVAALAAIVFEPMRGIGARCRSAFELLVASAPAPIAAGAVRHPLMQHLQRAKQADHRAMKCDRPVKTSSWSMCPST